MKELKEVAKTTRSRLYFNGSRYIMYHDGVLFASYTAKSEQEAIDRMLQEDKQYETWTGNKKVIYI